jgi:hypothetical protein
MTRRPDKKTTVDKSSLAEVSSVQTIIFYVASKLHTISLSLRLSFFPSLSLYINAKCVTFRWRKKFKGKLISYIGRLLLCLFPFAAIHLNFWLFWLILASHGCLFLCLPSKCFFFVLYLPGVLKPLILDFSWSHILNLLFPFLPSEKKILQCDLWQSKATTN